MPPSLKSRTATIPGFSAPETRPLDPLPDSLTNPMADPGAPTSHPAYPDEPALPGGNGGRLAESAKGLFQRAMTPRPATGRTDTSTAPGEPINPDTIARVTAGLIGLAVSAVAFLLIRTRGVQLRRPADDQTDAMAEPLARIMLRHVPIDRFPDLVDAIELANAAGEYISDGPLFETVYAPETVDPEGLQ